MVPQHTAACGAVWYNVVMSGWIQVVSQPVLAVSSGRRSQVVKPSLKIDAPKLATVRRTPLRATFIERPHRFAARCRLRGGREVEAHVPNPGRLTGVLAPGCQVLVDGPYPAPRALPYTMVAAKTGGVWIGTNTLYANRIFPALVSHGLFPEFQGSSIRAEVAHGRSRFDFQVGGRMVEVKSVTLASGSAGRFPDAVSARAARHCDELAALAAAGHPTAIVFVAQRGDVESVAPEDEIDPAFGVALRGAADAGVLVLACVLDIAPEGATRARRVPVLLGDA
jgi:sugar fermentation stimulation protein A